MSPTNDIWGWKPIPDKFYFHIYYHIFIINLSQLQSTSVKLFSTRRLGHGSLLIKPDTSTAVVAVILIGSSVYHHALWVTGGATLQTAAIIDVCSQGFLSEWSVVWPILLLACVINSGTYYIRGSAPRTLQYLKAKYQALFCLLYTSRCV